MNSEDQYSTAVLDEPKRVSPQTPVPKPVEHGGWDDEDEAPTGFKRFRAPLIVGVLTLGGIIYASMSLSKKDGPAPVQQVTQVRIMMPPPPPPPPPPPEAQKVEKMVEEEKPDEAPPEPSPEISTALKGSGAGGMSIKAGNGSGVFGNRNGGVNARAKWSAYASTAQARILDELRRNPKTRKAALRVEIRIWPDSTGRISRASIGTSSGDPAVDAAIRDEILTGLQLPQPPPEGMPTPIVMRVTARRPN